MLVIIALLVIFLLITTFGGDPELDKILLNGGRNDNPNIGVNVTEIDISFDPPHLAVQDFIHKFCVPAVWKIKINIPTDQPIDFYKGIILKLLSKSELNFQFNCRDKEYAWRGWNFQLDECIQVATGMACTRGDNNINAFNRAILSSDMPIGNMLDICRRLKFFDKIHCFENNFALEIIPGRFNIFEMKGLKSLENWMPPTIWMTNHFTIHFNSQENISHLRQRDYVVSGNEIRCGGPERTFLIRNDAIQPQNQQLFAINENYKNVVMFLGLIHAHTIIMNAAEENAQNIDEVKTINEQLEKFNKLAVENKLNDWLCDKYFYTGFSKSVNKLSSIANWPLALMFADFNRTQTVDSIATFVPRNFFVEKNFSCILPERTNFKIGPFTIRMNSFVKSNNQINCTIIKNEAFYDLCIFMVTLVDVGGELECQINFMTNFKSDAFMTLGRFFDKFITNVRFFDMSGTIVKPSDFMPSRSGSRRPRGY